MDCLGGGDLRHFLRINGALSEQSVMYIVGCIGSALHHMHERGVLHRDVKPENIGLDILGRPYLTDFGIAVVSSASNPIPICESSSGTLPYLAPEVLAPGNYHSYQADYWSLGVMGYELLFKCRPFGRRCPLLWIQFVANEYGWMWEELSKLTMSSNAESILPPSSPPSSPSLFTKFDFSHSSPLDWRIPFPELKNLYLNEDNSFPMSLTDVIPDLETNRTISEECKCLLSGLLDIRIPHRLGNVSKYSEFSQHPSFSLLDLSSSSPSPLSTLLQSHVPSIPPSLPSLCDEDEDSSHCISSFSVPLQKKLSEFYYLNPYLSLSSIKHKTNQFSTTDTVISKSSHRRFK